MAPRKGPIDPLLALLDPEEAKRQADVADIMDLLGVAPGKPKAVEPPVDPAAERERRKKLHLDALRDTEDTTGNAHVIMPTDLLDRYKEYDRQPGGAHYSGDFEAVKTVLAEQGKVRQPLWISTDGKTGMLIEGNNRLAVAKELGTPELPVRITFDRETRRNEGHPPVVLDDLLKKWVEENRIPGKYGRDSFPDDLVPQHLGQKPVPEETVTLYHYTNDAAAQAILSEGFKQMTPAGNSGFKTPVWFSDKPGGTKYIGKEPLSITVPKSVADEAKKRGTKVSDTEQWYGLVDDELRGIPVKRVIPGLESVAPLTRSRKSRSYANPEHAADILRYAPEDAYRNAVRDVNHRVVQYVQDAYASDHTFMANQAQIDRLTALIEPAVQAGQLQIADLTNAHLSSLFGVKDPPAPELSMFERQGVSRATELARPFWTAIKAARDGKDFDAALAAGEQRLTKMVETDLQMAKVRQAREVLKAGHIRTYARVTGDTPCWLCAIASTQVYYTEDLLPIHPSCVVSGTLVAVPSDQAGSASLLGSIEAATRQEFVGEIVELSTASGNLVRVTPNHPVLTDKGWIPAGLICKGDNVFRSLRGERPVDGRPDVAQRPSRIEDVFAAASVTGRLRRVPTTAEDFHGDGSDNEVDVVWTASDLTPPLDVLGVQQAGELCLMHAHGAGVAFVGQGAFDSLTGSRFASSRSGIRGGGDRGALFSGGVLVTQQTGGSRPSRFNPTAAQFTGEGRAVYAEQGMALQRRLAGKVERDSVIECRRVSFAGHVFNLQTAEGWYVADNIILSNCNCGVAPIPDGGERAIRNGFDPEEILAATDDQMKMMSSLVENEAPLSKYQDKLAIRDHGEIGPTLTWKHQNFTGPKDLPVPMSKEVLEHQAYETVKKNGGVTIDLGGNTPPEGYAYAPFKDTEMIVPQEKFTPEHIDRFINLHGNELAKPGNHLGMWTQNGNVYIDISRVGDPSVATLAKAQAAHQLAVFDLGTMEEINLGTIDKAGKYRSLGEASDIHRQYREQIARADEARSPAGVPGVSGLAESSSAPPGIELLADAKPAVRPKERAPVEWDGPPVAKPAGKKSNLYFDTDYNWQMSEFDQNVDAMREGARDVQSFGYLGAKEEAKDLGIRLPSTNDVGQAGPDMRLLQLEGRELAARTALSDPTDKILYRGIRVATDYPLPVDGDEISMPLSSFAHRQGIAYQFAGDKSTPGYSDWTSERAPEDYQGVVFQLQTGAKAGRLTGVYGAADESVTFGRFEVVNVAPGQYVPDEKYGPWSMDEKTGKYDVPKGVGVHHPTVVTIRQISLIEDEVAQPIPATSAVKEKIPEYVIINDHPPSAGAAPMSEAERQRFIHEVQPGPIPDYDNSYATSSQLWARRPDMAQVDLGRMHNDLARDTAQAIDDEMAKYPALQLRAVTAEGAHALQSANRFAETDGFTRKVLSGTKIRFNGDFYDSPAHLEKAYAKTTDLASRTVVPGTHPIYGYHPPLGEGVSAAKAIAVHEVGHSMDASGSYRASAAVKDTLRREFLRLNPYTEEERAIDRKLVENAAKRGIKIRQPIETRYEAWLQDSLPGYAFNKDGSLNPSEALAEAFGHTELSPHAVTDAERALHQLNVDMHDMPYRREMKIPEWQMASAAKEAAMSKESARLLKDYQKQVNEAVKVSKKAEADAARAAKAAEKAAAKAAKEADLATPEGQIREAKIQQDKGRERLAAGDFGDPNSIENVTRRGMDPERIKANREALWAEVPEPVRAQGKEWYPDDGQVLLDIHRDLGSPLASDPLADYKVRAIGSAFSPQVDWADAKTDVGNYLRVIGQPYQDRVDSIVKGRPRMVCTDSIKRADRVMAAKTLEEIDLALRGSQPTTSHYYDNSSKIRHFFPNLDGDLSLLTCDTWAGRAARLHPNERRTLINNDIRKRNASVKSPVPEEQLHVYVKGEQIPDYLVAKADKLADEANDLARAAGLPEPYLPSAPLMVQYGYDIIESATAAALPKGYEVADYQAGMWVWLRGSG